MGELPRVYSPLPPAASPTEVCQPNFTGDLAGDQLHRWQRRWPTSPVTSPVTKVHRWPTSAVTMPVTKLHRWPRRWPTCTGDQLHRWPRRWTKCTGDKNLPVTKLHRWPIVHRWIILPPQHGIGVLHCFTEAESLVLPGNKYNSIKVGRKALPNFVYGLWNCRLTWTRPLARGKSRKPRLHPGVFSRRNKSVIVPTEDRGYFQLPPLVQHPFSEPRLPLRLRGTRATEIMDWSRRPPTLAGSLFATRPIAATGDPDGQASPATGDLQRQDSLSITEDSTWKNPVNSSARSSPKKVGKLVKLGEFDKFA